MEQDPQQQCVFCHIANGKIPAKKVYEDDKLIAVLDINPAAEGHILLIPKKHVQIMPQMDDELAGHIGVISKQLSGSLIRALQVEGTTIFAANGAAAGQRAPHFMLHIIPRKQGDSIGLFLPENNLDNNTMKQVFERLAPAVAKQLGVEPLDFGEEKSAETEKPETEKSEDETAESGDKSAKPEDESETSENKESGESEKSKIVKPSGQTPSKRKKSNLDDIADLLTGGK